MSPPGRLEAIVSIFIPRACREEVLGDLHERFQSRRQYIADALHTVPLVIVSRMRRTADPQVLLIQACVSYASFLGAAGLSNPDIVGDPRALVRLAIPAAMALLGLIFDDAYANPARRPPIDLARGPGIGIALALASEGLLSIMNPELALSRWVLLYGCAMSLLLSTAVRLLFPPRRGQLTGHTKDDRMISKTKIALICAALVAAAGLIWIGTTELHRGTAYTYSDFLHRVNDGDVAQVIVAGSNSGAAEATCRLKNGKTVRTVLPSNYGDALRAMQSKLVDIEIRNDSRRFVANAAPFLVLLGVWAVLIILKL